MQTSKLIKAENILKKFTNGEVTNHVIKGIDLEVGQGELLVIRGASGSGKTTLMNILAGLESVTSGQVTYKNIEYQSRSDRELAKLRNKEFGVVFQSYHLFPQLNALENAAAPAYINGSIKNAKQAASNALAAVGLAEHADKYPSQLSGGQKQRAAIARAIINNPEVVFADEPTGNLDSISGRKIIKLFQKLNKEQGITFVIVTHDDQVASSASREVYLSDGYIQ